MNKNLKKSCLIYSMLCGAVLSGYKMAGAADCPSSDCISLGFDKDATACSGFMALRCPFDLSKYYCREEKCDEAFKYSCLNDGEAYGLGTTCNDLYSECICKHGYYRQDGSCKKCADSFKSCSAGYMGSGLSCGGYYEKCICADGYCLNDGICSKCPEKETSKVNVNASSSYSVYLSYGSNYGPGTTKNDIEKRNSADTIIASKTLSVSMDVSASSNGASSPVETVASNLEVGTYKLYIGSTSKTNQTGGSAVCSINKVIFNGICYEQSPGSNTLFGCNSQNAKKLVAPLEVEIQNYSSNFIQIYGICSRPF